ncbi:hypothetical protein [Corynebacterium rouxii]|uniref:hypothetical protein n=1 Tax=Corynebacterium rouxii TaxID=2719119 RepID=UPI003CC7CE8F
MALISETIAFSVIMPLVIALTGGRPAMITAAGVARLQRFMPRSVTIGFVNALGLMIFWTQLRYVVRQSWLVWWLLLRGGMRFLRCLIWSR